METRKFYTHSLSILFVYLFFGSVNIDARHKVQAVDFKDLSVGGELLNRMQKNFDRLEETKYQPDHVFLTDAQSGNWPGDTEGRTILGLVQDAKFTGRQPRYLDEIIRRLPAHLNTKGYMGKIHPAGILDEQQLSGNGWLVHALCEYNEWKPDPRIIGMVKTIVDSLFIPGKGLYKQYPIHPESRQSGIGEAMGTLYKSYHNWLLSTDVGCVFIGMDGIIQAYKYIPSPELKAVIDEMVDRFLEMDLIAIKAQTHASLTAMRGLLTYAALTGNYRLVREVEKRWRLYLAHGMMENYANYNWFCRYEAASEPCAIVDSYIVAMKLWEMTRKAEYLPYLDLIYYNALAHAQRANGGFGTDCFSADAPSCLSVNLPEAHWCCTMRGADGLAHVARSAYEYDARSVYLLHLVDSKATIRPSAGRSMTIVQRSGYPFAGMVDLQLTEVVGTESLRLCVKLPMQFVERLTVRLNDRPIPFRIEKGFVVLNRRWSKNDAIALTFENKLTVGRPLNAAHYSSTLCKVMRGPLLLSADTDRSLTDLDSIVKQGDTEAAVSGTDIVFRPIYHLMSPCVVQDKRYSRRVLFGTAR